MTIWEKAPYQRDKARQFTDTPLGRFLITRAHIGARKHLLFLNGKPTKYRGSPQHLKEVVERKIREGVEYDQANSD